MLRDRVAWLLILLGAAVRFHRIGGDLPYVFHYDEPTLVDSAVWLLQDRTLNPHFFNYPTGLIYLLAATFLVLLGGGLLLGRFGGWGDAIAWLSAGTYTRPPEGGVLYFYPTIGVPTLYLIGRSISVLAGVIGIGLVYSLARRLTGSRAAGRMAALMMAISPLAVEHAHLITTDTAAMALALASILATVHAEGKGQRSWAKAGVLAGLAAGVKYNAGIVALAIPLLAVRECRSAPRRVALALATAVAAAIAAFLLTTPYALLDSGRFIQDLRYEFGRIASITESFEGARTVEATGAEKIGSFFWHDLGLPGAVAAAWGCVVALRTRRYVGAAVVAWLALALLPLFRWQSIYSRYLLPVWPAVVLLATWGVIDLRDRLARATRAGRAVDQGLLALLAVAVLLLPTQRLIVREARRTGPDPRIEMTRWIEERIPAGERLVLEPAGAFPSPYRYSFERTDFLGRSAPERYRERGSRYLAGSGRERLVAGKEEYRSIFENLRAIREESRIVWSSDRYAIYELRGLAAWADSVREARAKGERAGAVEILERIARGSEANARAWKLLGELHAERGDSAAALAAYREAAALDPQDAEIPLAVSNLHLSGKDWDLAIASVEAAAQLAPDDPLISHNLAVALLFRAQKRYREGRVDAAREDWSAAIEHASLCARVSPGDPKMVEIRAQVERMGRRWGFQAEGRK